MTSAVVTVYLTFAESCQRFRDTMTAEDPITEAVRRVLRALCRPSSEARDSGRLTLGQLAARCGVDRSQLSRIRSGERGATAEHAEALAEALGEWADHQREARQALQAALHDQERR